MTLVFKRVTLVAVLRTDCSEGMGGNSLRLKAIQPRDHGELEQSNRARFSFGYVLKLEPKGLLTNWLWGCERNEKDVFKVFGLIKERFIMY